MCENIHSQISHPYNWILEPNIDVACGRWCGCGPHRKGLWGGIVPEVESTTVLRSVPPWMEHGRGSLDTNAHDPRFHPAIQISIPRRNRHPAPNDYLMFDNFSMDLCIFKMGFEWICAFLKKGFDF